MGSDDVKSTDGNSIPRGRGRRRWRSDLGVVTLAVVMLMAVLASGLAWAADSSGTGSSGSKKSAAAKPFATLRVLAPSAQVRRVGATTAIAARDGLRLRQGDTVLTDAAGLVQVDYTDGSLTRLGPTTEFTIDVLTEERGAHQTRGGLSVGETWSRAAKVTESGSFEVRAGGTTAAVEGTAFAFGCVETPGGKVCTIIDVVDPVAVTTASGGLAKLDPATSVVSTDDELGAKSPVTYEQLAANPFIVQNLLLDQEQGKGLGLADLPPPTQAGPTTITTAGITVTVLPAPAVTVLDAPAPAAATEPPPAPPAPPEPPEPPEPPSDSRCVGEGWTQLVGAGGETFTSAPQCSEFALAGGTFVEPGVGRFIVPAQHVATLTAASFSACDELRYGVQVNFGAMDEVAAKDDACVTAQPLPDHDIGPFGYAVVVRVFLIDEGAGTCTTSYTYFSDDILRHSHVFGQGGSSWRLIILDSLTCNGVADGPRPVGNITSPDQIPAGDRNFDVLLTITPPD
jgi:hypothetical protein